MFRKYLDVYGPFPVHFKEISFRFFKVQESVLWVWVITCSVVEFGLSMHEVLGAIPTPRGNKKYKNLKKHL